jgi:hypothetical protein
VCRVAARAQLLQVYVPFHGRRSRLLSYLYLHLMGLSGVMTTPPNRANTVRVTYYRFDRSILLPYTAENYPIKVRGGATQRSLTLCCLSKIRECPIAATKEFTENRELKLPIAVCEPA